MDDGPRVTNAESSVFLLDHHPNRGKLEIKDRASRKACQSGSDWWRTYWFLWRCVLLVWIFIALVAVLEALRYVSDTHGGVADADSQIFYLWQYIPTAIFVACSVIWAGLDYHVKQLAPWSAMSKSFARADQTLLVDYLSPASPVAILKSIRNKQFAVTIAVGGSLLLKLLAVLSTALFGVQQLASGKHAAVFRVTDQFSSSNMNIYTEDSRPVDTAFAILMKNLTYPAGTTDRFAVQSFLAIDNAPENATFTATVDAFSPALSCEVVSTVHGYDFGYSPSGAPGYLTVNLESASCGAAALESDFDYYDVDSAVLALLAPLECPKLLSRRSRQSSDDLDSYMLALAAVKISDMIWPEDGSPASATVDNASIVLCSPSYSIRPALVKTVMNATDQALEVDSTEGSARKLPGMTNWDAAQLFLNILSVSDLTNTQYWYLITEDDDHDSSYLKSLVTGFGTQSLWPTLVDPVLLSSTLEAAFNTSMVQIAKQMLTTPASKKVSGFYMLNAARIAVRALILRLLEAGLASALVLILVLTALLLRSRSPFRTHSTLAGIAAILSRSPDVSTDLMQDSALQEREYGTLLQDSSHQLCIVSRKKRLTGPRSEDLDKIASSAQYWLPRPLRLFSSIMTLVVPLVALAILEALLHISTQRRGLGQIGGKSDSYPNVWHIVSAGIMTMIATVFESLEFVVTNLETFRYLSRDAATAKDSILRNFNGRSSAYSLYQAFRYRRVTIAATAFLSLVSPFLTIFASGLYSAIYPEGIHLVSVTHLNWFNTTGNDITGFSSGLFETSSSSIDATLIQYDNLTYPQWTYSELALAQIAISNNSDHGTTLHAHIPAVRASVQCASYPSSAFSNATGPDSYFTYPVLDCGNASTPFNRTTPQEISIVSTYFNESGFFGGFYAPDSSFDHYYDATCGTFIFGLMQDANSTSAASFHALHCLFGVDQLLTDTVLSLPDYKIISTSPIESTSSYHSNLTLNPDKVLSPVNASLLYGGTAENDQYHGFLTTLTHGRDAIPAGELLTNTASFINALTHFYRVSMAQVMSEYFRADHPDQALPTALQPTSGSMTVLYTRVLQNATSTRLLQGLLALLVVLALIAQVGFRPRKILFENPNSIAALGRLLMGSELLEDEDLVRELREAQRCGWKRKEMEERGLLKGWRFGLREERVDSREGVAGEEDGNEREGGESGIDGNLKIGVNLSVKEKVKVMRTRKAEDESLRRRRVRLVATRNEI